MGLLEGKVAIVTGAGRGIGREHALLLAREGAAVMVNDLGGDGRGEGADLTPAQSVAEEIRAGGGQAAVNGANVADWGAAETLVAQTVETFGRLDILVNNAGILRDRMSFNMSEEEWDAVVNVVLKGSFAPARFAAAYWREQYKKTEAPSRCRYRQHGIGVRSLWELRPGQLRLGQSRPGGPLDSAGPGPGAHRRPGQYHRPGGGDATARNGRAARRA